MLIHQLLGENVECSSIHFQRVPADRGTQKWRRERGITAGSLYTSSLGAILFLAGFPLNSEKYRYRSRPKMDALDYAKIAISLIVT
jgi:hypothetical protein